MKELIKEFDGKMFLYGFKIYTVESTKIVNQKAIIKTDLKIFVLYESDLLKLKKEIKFIECMENQVEVFGKDKSLSDESNLSSTAIIKDQVYKTREMNNKMCEALFGIFNELKENPTAQIYKKAEAMEKAANSIVNVQVATLKYLTI